jgi:hypothetical protein
MGYFVTNQWLGSQIKLGRGATPQLDSGRYSVRLLLLKILVKDVVEKKYFVCHGFDSYLVHSCMSSSAVEQRLNQLRFLFDFNSFIIVLKVP